MQLPPVRQQGTLLRRYKRFLADVRLEDGATLTVHCPNSGSMRGCSEPGSPVVISRSDNPRRKYAWTLEMVRDNGVWIGVNTAMTNHLVHEALERGVIDDFGPVEAVAREVKVSGRSRLDFLVTARGRQTYMEVKNCSLAEEGVALFPDAVTSRGTRHLEELARLREEGFGAAVLFCVQRGDADRFRAAAAIDPLYAETLRRVHARGVAVLAYRAEVEPERILLTTPLPTLQ
ncbi:MAG TPA: DNA/RNA nuclease SfsA [Desulfobulbus sp.]|nr:DNA/RNA nuclease SfsA [Desulfobulbus sp.]